MTYYRFWEVIMKDRIKKDRSIKEAMLYALLILLMVISLNIAIKDHTALDISYLKLTMYSIPIILAVLIAIYFPVTILAAAVFGAGYTGYLALYETAKLELYYIKISDFIYWLQNYIIGSESFDLKYSYGFAILFIAVCSIIISLLAVSRKGSFVLIILGTAAHTFFWFMYVNKGRVLLLLFLFSSILLYAYKVYKKKSGEWLNNGSITADDIGKRWIANTSFILIFALAVTYMLPLNIKPFRWEWLNDKVINFFPFVLEWRNDVMDSYGYGFSSRYTSGIQGSGKGQRLGGPVFLDKSIMLSIASDSNDTLYLRGIVKDYYSGNSWSKSNRSSFQYKSNDTLALPYNVNEVRTYKRTINVIPKKLLTSTIFAPYKLYKVAHKDNRFFVDEDSEAYFSKLVTRKESYSIEYISPYLDENELRKIKIKNDSNMSYVQLPENVSERVRQLSRELTSMHDNDYDKIKAVENFLRTNYTYTLEPSVVPVNQEFVEHFLFEEKQGYCTYFATALAVLLRASDIPCRYVEGFMSLYEGSSSRDLKGTDAHAWVEVNFDKYGWITFEATPAYLPVGFREYAPAVETVSQTSSQREESSTSAPVETNRENNTLMDEDEFGTGEFSAEAKLRISIIIRNIIGGLLILRLLFLILTKLIKEIGLRKAKGRVFADKYVKNLLYYFKKMGYSMSKDETLREFAVKIKAYLEECSENLSHNVELLERIMYSSKDIKPEERQQLESYRKNIKRHSIERLGWFKYWWKEFFLGC